MAQLAGVMVTLLVLKGSFRVGQHGLRRSRGIRYHLHLRHIQTSTIRYAYGKLARELSCLNVTDIFPDAARSLQSKRYSPSNHRHCHRRSHTSNPLTLPTCQLPLTRSPRNLIKFQPPAHHPSDAPPHKPTHSSPSSCPRPAALPTPRPHQVVPPFHSTDLSSS